MSGKIKTSIYESQADKKFKTNVKYARNGIDIVSRAHYHNAVELNVVIKGTLGCCVDGKNYTATEGDIFYFDSMNVHYFDIKKGSETLLALIDVEMLRDFYRLYEDKDGNPSFCIHLKNKEKNGKIIKILMNWYNEFDGCNVLQNKGYVNLLFGEMIKEYDVHFVKGEKNKLTALKILRFLQENYKEKITLDMVANHFGYSKTSISRLFHSVVGQDIRTYVNMVRVEKAHELLDEDPLITVLEASFACGFDNMSSFYRAYNNRFGKMPRRDKK